MLKKKFPVNKIQIDNRKASLKIEKSSPRKYNLGRKTKITLNHEEIEINYEDMVSLKYIAQGRFGIVFKMKHEPTGNIFAVKRINDQPEHINENKEHDIMDLSVPLKVGNFPYLVKYYGALHADHYIWILNELMDTSFDFFYKKCFQKNIKIPLNLISRLAYSVLEAIMFLKKNNIIHRDIKPSNILINLNGEIKLCDFGVSGITSNSIAQTLTVGCFPYMPKEKIQLDEKKNGYTVKSDVWSLGISVFEIATGEHPYAKFTNQITQMREIIDGEAPRLDSTKYDVLLVSFIEQCLQKEVDDRMSPDDLLNHNFIKFYAKQNIDLNMIKTVVDLIQEEATNT